MPRRRTLSCRRRPLLRPPRAATRVRRRIILWIPLPTTCIPFFACCWPAGWSTFVVPSPSTLTSQLWCTRALLFVFRRSSNTFSSLGVVFEWDSCCAAETNDNSRACWAPPCRASSPTRTWNLSLWPSDPIQPWCFCTCSWSTPSWWDRAWESCCPFPWPVLPGVVP